MFNNHRSIEFWFYQFLSILDEPIILKLETYLIREQQKIKNVSRLSSLIIF